MLTPYLRFACLFRHRRIEYVFLYILRFTGQILPLQGEKWILSTKSKIYGETHYGLSLLPSIEARSG